MSDDGLVKHQPILLRPDPKRVVIRPFVPAEDAAARPHDRPRAQRIADQILALDDRALEVQLGRVVARLSDHHRNFRSVLLRRFHDVNGLLIDHCTVDEGRALLIGAYFSEEYAFEAAALFNPSIVAHPDQSGVPSGAIRFVMSLRGVGEGHVSSITFRTGLCEPDGSIIVDAAAIDAAAPRIESIPGGMPDDPGVRAIYEGITDLSEFVIFPMTARQRHGLEDLRLVPFTDDDGHITFFGTYTAFSGEAIRQELLRTTDFVTFELNALRGDAAANKGMALFPRRIGGRYAMLSRQDHENIWFLTSDDLYNWNGGAKAVAPHWPWEFVQMGNGGSPLEIDEGWLVITHGVGAVRTYSIGAALLDRDDPAKLLARTAFPLIQPDSEERYGYVPNVVYTCGAMLHGRTLILPYALADSLTTFATVSVDQLLATMS